MIRKQKNIRALLSLCLLAGLLGGGLPARARQAGGASLTIQEAGEQDAAQVYKNLLQRGRGDALPGLFERIFGDAAEEAAAALDDDSEQLLQSVAGGAGRRAEESLEAQIRERGERPGARPVVEPRAKPKRAPTAGPKGRPAAKSKQAGFRGLPKSDWRQLAFGFRPLPQPQDERPEIKMTETDTGVHATGSDKKSFETKDAKGTRTQQVETRYIKDGKTFGVEINNTQIIEAVSKADGKNFRQELSMVWGAEVAACPDPNGVSAGTGTAKVVSKTAFTEGGETVTLTSEFDLQAKLTGRVSDEAVLTHYDLQLDAYATNTGYEDALRRNVIKEIKIKDGRYGIHYDIRGNTIEVSDGKYGGQRTPAKMGKAEARKLTPMSDAETTLIGSAIGPMVPSIWNSANEMYQSAQKNWRNYGCVEVVCKAPKLTLEPGEQVEIRAETVHLAEGGKVNAQLSAEAYQGSATPESQRGAPAATFTFTQEGEGASSFYVESISRRGIGKGDVEFHLKKEKEAAEGGVWTGTITAERKQREEREKRSGANLAENGGYVETATSVRIKLTGRRDASVDATNAYLGLVTGRQEQVDYEYDRYKIDEGYCGANAVPYKGPKEITRTSRTIADFNQEARVYVEAGGTDGSITFSLPEAEGRTVHAYVHKSPCAEHDRANTNEAIDEGVATVGGSFSFSFPVDPAQKSIRGSINVREDDGGITTYTWELTRG
jgi:hypothetical protein